LLYGKSADWAMSFFPNSVLKGKVLVMAQETWGKPAYFTVSPGSGQSVTMQLSEKAKPDSPGRLLG